MEDSKNEECIKMKEYINELSDKELIVIYKDIDLYSEEIKEIIKNSSIERGIIKILDEKKIDKEKIV